MDTLIFELRKRYEGRAVPVTIRMLKDENLDLLEDIAALESQAKARFGKTPKKSFTELGLLDPYARHDEEARALVDDLVARYADVADKPSTVTQLKEECPGHDSTFNYLNGSGKRLFGRGLAEHLRELGVLGPRSNENDVEMETKASGVGSRDRKSHEPAMDAEALFDELRNRYSCRAMDASPERRERIASRYQGLLDGMLSEMGGWYPDKGAALSQVEVWAAHGSYVDRLASLARELGYGSWAELLRAHGWNMEPSGSGCAADARPIDVVGAVDHVIAALCARLPQALEKVRVWYPDGDASALQDEHRKFAEKLSRTARNLGYEGWRRLLSECGYEVGEARRGGRPKANDFDAIIAELQSRYAGREAPATVKELKAENPDLAGKLTSLNNQARARYGKTAKEVLREAGVLSAHAADAETRRLERDAVALAYAEELVKRYADAEEKPASIGEIQKADSDHASELSYLERNARRLLGSVLRKYLQGQGVLASKQETRPISKEPLTDAQFEQIMAPIQARYETSVRERTLDSFAAANPSYVAHEKEVAAYLKARGTSPAKYLREQGLLSKVAREDSLPRPSQDVIDDFERSIPHVAYEELERHSEGQELLAFESLVRGSEEAGTARLFEMLRVGDFLSLSPDEAEGIAASFCGYHLGRLAWAMYGDTLPPRAPDDWEGIAGDARRALCTPAARDVIGGHVYCRVVAVGGKPEHPYAVVLAYWAEDVSSRKQVDGMLLSADGTCLIKCLSATSSLRIPDGVEVIAPRAFEGRDICEVILPDSLKEIGERAFALTKISRVTIPVGVANIGAEAFSLHLYDMWDRVVQGRENRCDGPAYYEVESGNARYASTNGSLIERNERGGRLVSLWYDHGGKPDSPWMRVSVEPTFPQGIDSLAPGCIIPGQVSMRLRLPDSLTVVEAHAIPGGNLPGALGLSLWKQQHYSCESMYIPSNLASIIPDPDCSDHWHKLETGNDGQLVPLDVFPCGERRVAVHPKNPCFSVVENMLHVWFREEDAVRPLPEGAKRPCDAAVNAQRDRLLGRDDAPAGSVHVEAEHMLRANLGGADLRGLLREGDVLEIAQTEDPCIVNMLLCGREVGWILDTKQWQVPSANSRRTFEESGAHYVYSHTYLSDSFVYEFVFDDDEDENGLDRSLERALEPQVCRLGDMTDRYESLDGVGRPYGIVTGFHGPVGRAIPSVRLHYAFGSKDRRRWKAEEGVQP